MKLTELLLFVSLAIWIYSCEKSNEPEVDYSSISEINLPTSSPRGLAFDGKYLWYSDDSLNCLYRISEYGDILKTIQMPSCRLTGFDFQDGNIWCINDKTIGHETVTQARYPLSCIYKISLAGKKLDTILIQHAGEIRPIFLGLTITQSTIYGSTNQGYSSHLYKIDLENEQNTWLRYCFFSGLTVKNDTIFAIDVAHVFDTKIGPLDPDYKIIEDKAIIIDFRVTDLVFINNDLWVCDREEIKLKRIR